MDLHDKELPKMRRKRPCLSGISGKFAFFFFLSLLSGISVSTSREVVGGEMEVSKIYTVRYDSRLTEPEYAFF